MNASTNRALPGLISLLILAIGSTMQYAHAQAYPIEVAKLLASDNAANDEFGYAVSICGDTAIVGARRDDDNGENSGSAHVFENIGGVWTQVAKLLPSDGAANDEFGYSVSISGDTALVGALWGDDNGLDSGSAYVFEKIGGVWTETAKLLASDGAAHDWFGVSVSISGDTAIVGALADDDNGPESGSAYVFERIGGVWTETAKLLASDGSEVEKFGQSVSTSGDAAIVGAFGDNSFGWCSGSAYVFERIGGAWTETAKLLASDGASDKAFGWSVSISGNAVLVGAHGDHTLGPFSGSAYVFEKIGGAWTEVAKLLASDGAESASFGSSVSLSGETAVVGALGGNGGTGSAYVFERIGGAWTETASILASDGAFADTFGHSVSLYGDTTIVGAKWDDDNGDESGSAYIFDLNLPNDPCPADVTGDGTVDVLDLLNVLAQWGMSGVPEDINGDGIVNVLDMLEVLGQWGPCP